MPIVSLTNTGKGPRVVPTKGGGFKTVERGQTVDRVPMTEGDLAALAGGPLAVSNIVSDDENTSATGSVTTQHVNDGRGPAAPSSPYAVERSSPGWFVITKDGKAVTKSFRKDDVDGFDEFSEEDKAAFVEANKADD